MHRGVDEPNCPVECVSRRYLNGTWSDSLYILPVSSYFLSLINLSIVPVHPRDLFIMVSSLLTLLFPVVSAIAVAASGPKCIDLTVPVHVESKSYPLLIPVIKNGYEGVELVLQASKRDGIVESILSNTSYSD